MRTTDEVYHSELEGIRPRQKSYYHALSSCPVGRHIPDELRKAGRGGRQDMCPACAARLRPTTFMDTRLVSIPPVRGSSRFSQRQSSDVWTWQRRGGWATAYGDRVSRR